MKCSEVILTLTILGLCPAYAAAAGTNCEVRLPAISWGQQTNGVCAGLQVEGVHWGKSGLERLDIAVFLRNLTEEYRVFVLPDREARFQITITDDRGALLPRTRLGARIGKALPETKKINPKYRMSLKRVFLRPRELELHEELNLAEGFRIPGPGNYRIECEVRLQSLTNDWMLRGFVLPRATMAVDLKAVTSLGH